MLPLLSRIGSANVMMRHKRQHRRRSGRGLQVRRLDETRQPVAGQPTVAKSLKPKAKSKIQ